MSRGRRRRRGMGRSVECSRLLIGLHDNCTLIKKNQLILLWNETVLIELLLPCTRFVCFHFAFFSFRFSVLLFCLSFSFRSRLIGTSLPLCLSVFVTLIWNLERTDSAPAATYCFRFQEDLKMPQTQTERQTWTIRTCSNGNQLKPARTREPQHRTTSRSSIFRAIHKPAKRQTWQKQVEKATAEHAWAWDTQHAELKTLLIKFLIWNIFANNIHPYLCLKR